MPQPRPAYISGGYYHLFNRGSHKASIFRETDNYLFVLRSIKKYLSDLNLTPIAYCLMPNHYHFLIRQDGDIPAGMLVQRVFNSYSKAYNKRYQHSGTLFEDNYRVKSISQTTHLLHLCRYIHANPVKDGIVSHPADWPYSNYQEWVGSRSGTLVDLIFVRFHFPTSASYIEFVDEYLRDRNHPPEIAPYLEKL
jgi:REP element-mobilizing transposase RayT